jgi:4-hydroxy-2-oxoglutarate aldolase
MLLEGLYLPLTTPFYPNGGLNPHKFESNVARYSKTPAAGLVLLAAQGEGTLLTDEETRIALRTAAGAALDHKVLIAQLSRDSVAATLELIDVAAAARYDAALVGLPSILTAASLAEALLYFRAIADHAAIPLILWNNASRPLTAHIVAELASHPQILGLFDAGSDLNDHGSLIQQVVLRTVQIKREVTVTPIFAAVTGRMAQSAGRSNLISAQTLTVSHGVGLAAPTVPTLRTRTRVVGFQVLAGRTAGMLEGLRSGAVGVVPGFGGCAPQACYEVYAAWKDGDQGLADEKQDRLLAAAHLAEDLGVGGIKFGCDLNGYYGGHPRLPLLPPNGNQRAELERLMLGLRS